MDLTPFEDAGFYDPQASDAADVRAMLEYLDVLGVGTQTLLQGFREDWVHSAGLELLLTEGTLTTREAAERAGIPVEQVIESYRLLGIALPGADARLFLPEEADLLSVVSLSEEAFEDGEGDEILRATSAALTAIAESIVSVFVGGAEDRIDQARAMSLKQRAELVQVTGQQALVFGRALGFFFRHHLRQAIIRQRSSMVSASDRQLRTMTIGFVDLVGFTSLSASMSAAQLVTFVRDFEARSYDVASRAGGRIVKIIGDEVMVSALDVETGCEIVVGLIEEFRGSTAADPRGGLASGEVVARFGDFFGPVVNLASRLVDEAVPGEVLAEAEVTGTMHGQAFACEPAGRRMLKGFHDPVRVVTIHRR